MSVIKNVLNQYESRHIKMEVYYEWTIKDFLIVGKFQSDSVVHYDNQMLNRNLDQKWKNVTNFDEKKAIKVAPKALDGIKN